jgi:hypothetical protein
MEVNGQLHALATLPSEEDAAVPIGCEAKKTSDPVWTLWNTEKSLTPAMNRTPYIQTRSYTIYFGYWTCYHIIFIIPGKKYISGGIFQSRTNSFRHLYIYFIIL